MGPGAHADPRIEPDSEGGAPADGLLSVDITAAGYNCFDRFPVAGPRSLIYPRHSVSLGFAFPAAVARLAAPERPVVSLSGDGGFVMGLL